MTDKYVNIDILIRYPLSTSAFYNITHRLRKTMPELVNNNVYYSYKLSSKY